MNRTQKFIVIKSALLLLATSPVVEVSCITIQALINLDNDSEDLIGLLIEKLDSIIDPKVSDSQNATNELAYALLRIGPLITMNGTISDATKGLRLSFSCNLKADTTATAVVSETDISDNRNSDGNNTDEEEIIWKSNGGILNPIVQSLDPIVQYLILLILNGIISNLVTNIMTEAALLSNVNFV